MRSHPRSVIGPGRIAAEIKVTLKHPRNRLDPEFRQLVDKIYALMTQRSDSKQKSRDGNFPGLGFGMILPRVSTNSFAGLLEALAAAPYVGKAELPELAGTLQMEIDELFPSRRPCNSCVSPRSTPAKSVLHLAGRNSRKRTSTRARRCSAITCLPMCRSPRASVASSTSAPITRRRRSGSCRSSKTT